MRRVYQTSRGPVEVALNTEERVVVASLFDADGLDSKHTADEWDHAAIGHLLHKELGLPESESQSIAERFLAGAKSEGHEQPPDSNNPIAIVALVGFFVGVLALIGVGLWTIVSWII